MAVSGLTRRRQEQKGAAAIEFALVFPLFLLVLLAVVVWSTFFFVQSSLDYAAREAVRAALVVDPEVENYHGIIRQKVTSASEESIAILPESWKSSVTHSVTIENGSGEGDADYVVLSLRYPQGTPVSGLTDLGLFQGIGLIPEGGAYAEARMPLRVTE